MFFSFLDPNVFRNENKEASDFSSFLNIIFEFIQALNDLSRNDSHGLNTRLLQEHFVPPPTLSKMPFRRMKAFF